MSATEPWRNPPPAPNLDEVRYRMSPRPPALAFLQAWWPALLWAALIFVMSTDTFSASHTGTVIERVFHWLFPTWSGATLDFAHHVVRKCAHFAEYFIFFLLLYRGMRSFRGASRGWHWSWAFTAWLIAAGYSILDEVHQIFVPSRGPSALDSLLDSTAALVALIVLFLLYRRFLGPPAT